MSVLIPWKKKPTSCGQCLLCLDDSRICHGYCMIFHRKVNMMEVDTNCPLIELPPHGALIDMDDFLSEWSELESYRTAMRLCEVIPAEDGET